MSEQLTLIPYEPITVHCFLAGCNFTVKVVGADRAHAEMERHYGTTHKAVIDRLCGIVKP